MIANARETNAGAGLRHWFRKAFYDVLCPVLISSEGPVQDQCGVPLIFASLAHDPEAQLRSTLAYSSNLTWIGS